MVRRTLRVHDGFFDAAQRYIHENKFFSAINGGVLLSFLLSGFSGFVIGCLCKQFGKYVLVWSCFILIMSFLQYADLLSISVHYAKLGRLLGVQLGTTYDQAALWFMIWVRTHVAKSVVFLAGFLFGIFFG